MAIDHRYDFVLLFDVQDGNPNGDPDAGNLPRVDPETGHGLVTDVCLKRKLRNYVLLTQVDRDGYDIFVKEKAVLNRLIEAAHDTPEVKSKAKGERTDAARQAMCKTYFDVRTFGAVMSTGEKEKNAGQVRGPVQLTFSRSIEPIVALEHSITRMAVTTEAEAAKQSGDNRTMGRKATISYGLYRCHGFVSPALADQTGFSDADLDIVWNGLLQMFEHDRSAARGLMTTRKLVVFEHQSKLGDASAARLFERVGVRRRADVESPRSYSDFEVAIDRAGLEKGITIHERR